MERDKREFEVLPAGEMRAKYGLTPENRPAIRLDPKRVPATLHCLIPLAEQFGIGDDLIREDLQDAESGPTRNESDGRKASG